MKFSVLITKPGHENDGKWWHQDGANPVGVQYAGKWHDEDYTISEARSYEKLGKVKIVPSRDRFRFDLDVKHQSVAGRHHVDEQIGGAHDQDSPDRFAPSIETALREYTSAERKAIPIDAGCIQYFPDAIAAVARVSVKGNDKHNPGQPLHWSRGKSNDHAECVTRHRLTPDAIDPETNEPHRNHALWRLLAEVQIAEEKRLIAAGIKPLSGVTQ